MKECIIFVIKNLQTNTLHTAYSTLEKAKEELKKCCEERREERLVITDDGSGCYFLPYGYSKDMDQGFADRTWWLEIEGVYFKE